MKDQQVNYDSFNIGSCNIFYQNNLKILQGLAEKKCYENFLSWGHTNNQEEKSQSSGSNSTFAVFNSPGDFLCILSFV